MKKRRFSGLRKQPVASFAEAVTPQDNTFDDGASIATGIAAMAPLLGATASSPPRKTRAPFRSPVSFRNSSGSFRLKSSEGSFKIGKHKSDRSQSSAVAPKRKRWKPSTKIGKIPSKINLASNSRSYDSFATSRGNPSPPPAHVEKLGHAPQQFMEYTFDFDFLPEPNHFQNSKSEEVFMRSSTTSSETPPPPPPPPIEPFFVPSFNPIVLDEDMSYDFGEMKIDEASNAEGQKSVDSEHLMSASAGIQYFESLSPTALTLPSGSSFQSFSDAHKQEEVWDAQSASSIPSINEDECMPSIDASHSMNQVSLEPETANTKDASDSVIAWTLLGAVMGSPAPQSVLQTKQKRDCANLWMNEDAETDLNNELPDIEDNDSSITNLDTTLPPLPEEDECDNSSIPDVFDETTESTPAANTPSSQDAANNTLAWSALTMLLGSPAPSCVQQKKSKMEPKNLWAEDSIDENDELLSLADFEINEPADDSSLPVLDDDDLSLSGLQLDSNETHVPKNEKDATDSAIFWTALSALLASPAPSCVRKRKEKRRENLWTDGNAGQDDELISLSECDEALDDFPAPTKSQDEGSVVAIDISLSALQLDSDDLSHFNEPEIAAPQKTEEVANSTLAWGALTALLGLPAPSSVVKKNSRPKKNLWADGDDEDLVSLTNFEVDDTASVPSLVADSQVDSAPSSPLVNNASSCNVTSSERENVTIQTFIECRDG